MKHIEMFNYICKDDSFSWETKNLVRVVNNSTDLETMVRELTAALRFAKTKLEDTRNHCQVSNDAQTKQFLLGDS